MTAKTAYGYFDSIQSREDFVAFVEALRASLHDDPGSWENPDLDRFLQSLGDWVKVMDDVYRSLGKPMTERLVWKDVGQILLSASTQGLQPCPCCGSRVISDKGDYEICDICGWEDDPVQSANAAYAGGANKLSLNEAREVFRVKGKYPRFDSSRQGETTVLWDTLKYQESIRSREDFVTFVHVLRASLHSNTGSWKNPDLERYLEALGAWVDVMHLVYGCLGKPMPEKLEWRDVGQILLAASAYERTARETGDAFDCR